MFLHHPPPTSYPPSWLDGDNAPFFSTRFHNHRIVELADKNWNSQGEFSLKTEERFIKGEHFHGREKTAKSQRKMEKENEKVVKTRLD